MAKPLLERRTFADLPGWSTYDVRTAKAAFDRSCREIVDEGKAFGRDVQFGGARGDWLEVCAAAAKPGDPRAFFEANFTPVLVNDPARPEGLFTGYFEPEAAGSRAPSGVYKVPVYRKPVDLVPLDEHGAAKTGLRYGRVVDGEPRGYFTRREIETGALQGRGLEIVWLKDWADAFFIHIQGSGRVRLPDGSLIRLAYAAKTGLPYTGIGGVLIERGVLTKETNSMQAIRRWLADHPEDARELMWENKSFVFFREVEIEDPKLGPPGAQKVNLTPFHSLAVDRGIWMFGTPFWLETTAPFGPDETQKPFVNLMVAQDTGTAIKGYARGDVFWGAGEDAALTAGHMKSPGRLHALLPKAVAGKIPGLE